MSSGKTEKQPVLIGIGASAGGLEPLQDLLSNLPSDLQNAAIIVAQHLSPNYKSKLVELLGRKTTMTVVEASAGARLSGNTVYTIPPDTDAEVKNGCIFLKKIKHLSPKPNIDTLFSSLAKEGKTKALGIVLSGTGNDGAAGIASIKQNGGITICQLPETAKYDGMPKASIATGQVDHKLKPEDIGSRLLDIIKRKPEKKSKKTKVEHPIDDLLEMIEQRVGTDFSNYKKSTFNRRLEKRMSDMKFTSVPDYLRYIRTNPDELDALFQYLLIGVTSFFRNPECFEQLGTIINKIIENKSKNDTFRIWVPACATGEEAYSITILALEAASKQDKDNISIQIFASDIDQNALLKARQGIYEASRLENVPEEIRQKYFVKKGKNYEVITKLKKLILFTRHDVLSNPPFLRIDLISCRNLLIYFNQELQKQIIPTFHYSLVSDGYLILGKSETIGDFKSQFNTIDSRNKIYQRKPGAIKSTKFPFTWPGNKPQPQKNKIKKERLTVSEMVKETIYATLEHPYVVIDNNLDMQEVYGNISPYVQFREGSATMNLLRQIHEDLQIELRALAGKAINSNEIVKGRLRKIPFNDTKRFLRINIKPLLYSRETNPLFIVIFEEYELEESVLAAPNDETTENIRMNELEQELNSTKEHMNTLLEELEASNEELQAMNEELQSSNEELQASNEELETSNEELQATNEELETAYAQLNQAVEEIEKQHKIIKASENNLQAIFNNTLQAFILVDSNYHVLVYNETASRIYKELYGKQIMEKMSYIDIIPEENFGNFRECFKMALEGKMTTSYEEVTNLKNQKRYLQYHYSPIELNDADSARDRVIVSFIDDTARKNAEAELTKAMIENQRQKELWEEVISASPDLIAILRGEDFVYEYVNPSFQRLLPDQDLIGRPISGIFDQRTFLQNLKNVRESGTAFRAIEAEIDVVNSDTGATEKRYFNYTYAPLHSDSDKFDIVLYATDITAQVLARLELEDAHQQIEIQKARLEDMIHNAPAYIAVLKGSDHFIEFANPLFKELVDDQDLIGKRISQSLPELKEQGLLQKLDEVFQTGELYFEKEVEGTFNKSKNDKKGYYNFVLQPWKDTSNQVIGILMYGFDVTDQVRARKQLEQTMHYFRTLTDAMPQKVWTADASGKFDFFNKIFYEYIGGLQSDPNIGWEELVHPEDLDITLKSWENALQEMNTFQVQHRLKGYDGEYKWHLTRGKLYEDKNLNIFRWFGTTTDIHEQKTAEQVKEEFLSIASHELKTPLTTIKAYFEILKMHLKNKVDEETNIYLHKADLHLKDLNDLISDLLDISRIEAGRLQLKMKNLSFDHVVEEAIEDIQHTTKSHKIILKGKTNKQVKADKQRLKQVLSNLLSNAIKYSPDSDEVVCEIFPDGEYVKAIVMDHGIGIPRAKLDKIFDRFYRVSDEEHISGLGIGLYITKEIVSKHKGMIWAESDQTNGTKFHFKIPSADN